MAVDISAALNEMIREALIKGEVGRLRLSFADIGDGKPKVVLIMVLNASELLIEDAPKEFFQAMRGEH